MDPNNEVALENIFSDLVSQYGKLYGHVKLASGQTCSVDVDSVAGYCHKQLHPGAVTGRILNHKGCIQNQCPYFQKFAEAVYWIKCSLKPGEKIKTTLLSGETVIIRKTQLVGYCHYSLHPGNLTAKLMADHECLKKNCRCFEKNISCPYWLAYQSKKNAQRIKKAQEQRKIKEEEDIQLLLIREIQRMADQLPWEIKILQVLRKSDSNSTIVYYISKASIDDSPRFHCMVKPLRALLKTKKVIFKHIKNPDGTYAVF